MEGRASSLSLRERAGVRVDPVVNAVPSAFCRPLALTLSPWERAGVRVHPVVNAAPACAHGVRAPQVFPPLPPGEGSGTAV